MKSPRAVWRSLRHWLSGPSAPAPARWTEEEIEQVRSAYRTHFHAPLLTGLRLALEFGPSPHQEPPYARALDRRRRSHLKPGMRIRIVGKPLVYRTSGGRALYGVTEWASDYVSRQEQLQARRVLRQSRRMAK